MIWVTADTHFGHTNILRHCNRPFLNIQDHDQTLITIWNEHVALSDIVYHLGDFAFRHPRPIFERLNGVKHLIVGNHDPNGTKRLPWASVQHYLELSVNDRKVVLCHYPFESWRNRNHGSIHLHGHCHGTIRTVPNRLDVGVDVHGFKPLPLDEAINHAQAQTHSHPQGEVARAAPQQGLRTDQRQAAE